MYISHQNDKKDFQSCYDTHDTPVHHIDLQFFLDYLSGRLFYKFSFRFQYDPAKIIIIVVCLRCICVVGNISVSNVIKTNNVILVLHTPRISPHSSFVMYIFIFCHSRSFPVVYNKDYK